MNKPRDTFCWSCHLKYDERANECSSCLRVYHLNCLVLEEGEIAREKQKNSDNSGYKCQECQKAANSLKIPHDQKDKYCRLLEYAIICLKSSGVS